ncbi:fibrillin-2-like [Dreissena polymorpha]|uniref:fibrillin-2-like n=1 Tax=Dreissena polymorpha TaxID=45954 RepID=UPI002263DC93|nr:fibrillin-2-like [Dreissena polymorpha]
MGVDNIDEFSSQPGICQDGECINNQGSFRCECPRGFVLGPDRRTCLDRRKDSCFLRYSRGQCSNPSPMLVTKSTCCCMVDSMEAPGIAWGVACEPCPSMSDPEFKTLCKHGSGTDHDGGAINHCALMPEICENGACENSPPSYRCVCNPGYLPDSSGKRCINVNECMVNPRLCEGGQCRDTPGSFVCTCPSGSRLDPSNNMCEDIDECRSSPCQGGTCINSAGSFRCKCDHGFSLDVSGLICVDERLGSCWMRIRDGQCEDNVKRPMLKSECCNTVGKAWGSPCEPCAASIRDRCPRGFIYKRDGCVDINECEQFADLCRGGGVCVNTEGSFTCQCPSGMELDPSGTSCLDKRKSTCYLEYRRGQCSEGLDSVFTRSMCCCTVGKAWSHLCEPCPTKGTEQHKALCPVDGHGGDPVSPIDINECREIPGICTNGQCRNTLGSFTCTCDRGFALDARGFNCTDIDECRISFGVCENGACVNTEGMFRCECNQGYTPVMMAQMCMDVNECEGDKSLCRGGTCHNEPGNFRCECPTGLELSTDERSCVDIDECGSSSSVCSNGYCENFMGGYHCRCHTGFKPNTQQTSCVDIDECAENNGGCEMLCVNSPGSFACGCEMGFTLMPNGRNCKDYNECRENPNICNGGKCNNTPGAYRCICTDGLRSSQDMKQCIDIDECSENRNLCENGVCENLPGSYRCNCDNGFDAAEGSNRCTDIDECLTGKNMCDEHATCLNTASSYRCQCKPGFEGDQGSTLTISTSDGVCSQNAVCVNEPGNYACICEEGFTGDGFNCRDIDECSLREDLCVNGRCYNFIGGYRCTCNMGFARSTNEKSCIDIDECQIQNLCVNGDCVNTIGAYECRCKPGFKLDDIGDINECADVDNCLYGTPPPRLLLPGHLPAAAWWRLQLHHLAERRSCGLLFQRGMGRGERLLRAVSTEQHPRVQGTLHRRLGLQARSTLLPMDIDECHETPCICKNGDCQNMFGSYKCICPVGYMLNLDTQECVDIDKCVEYPGYCGLGTCVNRPGNFSCLCPDGYMPMAGEGCMDMRKDACYAAFTNAYSPGQPPRCDHQLSSQVTKRQCCCVGVLGQGWGNPCEPCPVKNSRAYLDLCKPNPIREDTNESSIYQFLCENGRCIDTNTEEGFLCECGVGYTYNAISKRCDDVDKCRASRNPCHDNAICINTLGSYRCECIPGYQLASEGGRCIDINECQDVAGICTNGDCRNLEGSYQCICKQGYRLAASRDFCLDTDECREFLGICMNARCRNTPGSFLCECLPGYTQSSDRMNCRDLDECTEMSGLCRNGYCINTDGSFQCNCREGYRLSRNTDSCEDINECRTIENLCANGRCINEEGSFRCVCPPGYVLTMDGRRCIDLRQGNCYRQFERGLCLNPRPVNHTLTQCCCTGGAAWSYVGSELCEVCPIPGERRYQEICGSDPGRQVGPSGEQDLNECMLEPDLCKNGRCINTDGSFRCECLPGYELNSTGRSCVDKDECRVASVCGEGECSNTNGSFSCDCKAGFAPGPSEVCEDIDECVTQANKCAFRCANTVGSFKCVCPMGYQVAADGIHCEDVDECLTSTHGCPYACKNLVGSFMCICPEGYREAGRDRCIDIDECLRFAVPAGVRTCRGASGVTAHRVTLGQRTARAASREDYCYTELVSRRCVTTSDVKVTTQAQCCCTGGAAWGRRCEICPRKGTDAYSRLCPAGGGYDIHGNDIDECRLHSNLCENGRCMNTMGSYRCLCNNGYKPDTTGTQCIDIDECTETQSPCVGTCQNLVGSFKCICGQGYVLNMDGRTCRDIDECATGQHNCPQSCVNTIGSFECGCAVGYTRSGDRQCVDINECLMETNLCTPNGQCKNTPGGYECVCNRGYKLDPTGKKCIDVDECADGQCENLCENSFGGFLCGCPEGYTEYRGQCLGRIGACLNILRRKTFTFIDVCTGSPCVFECVPAGQMYTCGCPPGYQMIGEGHCIQTISPSEYKNMFPPGVNLPHESSLGTGELPPGEGCYSCNIGDARLEVPLSKRTKRGIVQNEVSSSRKSLIRNNVNEGTVEDIHTPNLFRPKLLRVTKRAAVRQRGNVRRHNRRQGNINGHLEYSGTENEHLNATQLLAVYVDLSDVGRKTDLVKILPALSILQGNVNYTNTNRADGIFFLKEKNGVNSLHAKHKKLFKGMSYHIDIEAVPVEEDVTLSGHDVHLGKTVFRFFVYVL